MRLNFCVVIMEISSLLLPLQYVAVFFETVIIASFFIRLVIANKDNVLKIRLICYCKDNILSVV